MNLFSYVDEYGDYSFLDVSFNEVDNAVMSSLSYIDFKGIVSGNIFNKKTLKEVGDEFFLTRYSKRDSKNILAVRQAIKLLRYIKDTKRYGNLYLYNYAYVIGAEIQFSVMSIDITSKLVYVSFEGTDHLISGWKEDFMMCYKFPTLSQKMAISYVNRNFSLGRKKIILGGHSKGGNLAMVSGMYANFFVRRKIVNIYNNDGPGLLSEEFNSKYYLRIKDKLIHIVPNYSIVGLLLRHSDDYVVVRSFRKSIYSHDLFTWVVRGSGFEKCCLSSFSEKFDNGLVDWLEKYDKLEREYFVNSLFYLFERANIYSLIDLFENKRLLFKLLSEVREIDDNVRNILKDFIKYLFKCFKDVKIEELKGLLEK